MDKHIEEHKLFLKKFYDKGFFLLSGRKNPRTGGIIITNASDEGEVEMIIGEDPFYINDIADYTVTNFTPTLYSTEFENIKSLLN